MSHIILRNAGVTYPVYNGKTRSIKNKLFSAIGGKVESVDSTLYVKALDNLNLIIRDGEKVGLVGHNGAGKSTLLRLLAGIYEPTTGTIDIEGKISSLTNISMGMDPESTGYENIIARCVLMGLTFAQAHEHAEEIIEFSELQEYINLPMRTYSLGMSLRLAYTISTSIIPDILIMDEIINAGDAKFVTKAKNRSISLIEKTKIMVITSHDTSILQDLCTRGILMKNGQVILDDKIDNVIEAYKAEA